MPGVPALNTRPPSATFSPRCRRRRQSRAPAASTSWLPDAPDVFVSTRRASVTLDELLPLLREAQGAPDLDAAPVATALARSTVVVAAFVPDASATPPTPAPVGLSWLVPRPPPRRLVGYARAASDGALVATVGDVAVAPRLQRTGVGRRLLAALLKELAALGVADVGSLVPPAAVPFFAACQFGPDTLGAIHMALPFRTAPAPTRLDVDRLVDTLRAELAQAVHGVPPPKRPVMRVRAPLR